MNISLARKVCNPGLTGLKRATLLLCKHLFFYAVLKAELV